MPHYEREQKEVGTMKERGISEETARLVASNPPASHFHTTDKIDFRDLLKKKLYIHHTIYGVDAATAGNYGVFWIAPFACVVSEIREVHQTAGSSADAALTIEKLTGTQALDAGVALNTAI